MEDWEWKQLTTGNSHIRPPPTTATCAFCIKAFSDGDKITRLSCHHYFHRPCILRWLSRHKYCPICLRSVPFPTKPPPPVESGRRHVPAVQHIHVDRGHYRRPRCLWFYQLMELIESLFFRDD
ncbi:hypothetical protein L6452_29803 [Arctium lappa]|uniref:Uncharacterized protein n=1 Tax=Arctium lappa TaxID=4217 RepID=A0ACB8ZII4_ARCLA|nr:hypothetical protein L6452_29803 [Arctium lappa]